MHVYALCLPPQRFRGNVQQTKQTLVHIKKQNLLKLRIRKNEIPMFQSWFKITVHRETKRKKSNEREQIM